MVLSLSFEWRHLLFANWPVDSHAVAARLPAALDVDEYDGTAWLSVVPLLNADARPRGLPTMAGFPRPEVHLRTYVSHDGDPGVYFFSLDAAGLMSVVAARFTHHLPYYYARVRFRRSGDRVHVTSRRRQPGDRPARFAATYGPTGEAYTAPRTPSPSSSPSAGASTPSRPTGHCATPTSPTTAGRCSTPTSL